MKKLAVFLPGLGAVSTTFIAGVMGRRAGGPDRLYGSLTQRQAIRLGHRDEGRQPLIRELLPLAALEDLEFAAWDPVPDNAYEAAAGAGVLRPEDLSPIAGELRGVRPLPAVFDPDWVPNLGDRATNVKPREAGTRAQFDALRSDIRGFMERRGCGRGVMVWCGSTERFGWEPPAGGAGGLVDWLKRPEASVPPSVLYAMAAFAEGLPFANGAPNSAALCPAMLEMAEYHGVPVAGMDFKTGQTMLKTALAPALKARMLGLDGWFSTNILGNRDGQVLADPGAFRSKEASKLGALSAILEPELYPDLYGEADHQVRINYYRPRGDAKEGWDAIDIFGWMGYPMGIKVNFLCRDSILAAPIVLDLALLLDLAARQGETGVQEWLSFYFKSPALPPGARRPPEHDLFIQHWMLKNQLRRYAGEAELTHTEEIGC